MKSEEQRVLEEVARVKRRAHELGIVTNVFELYFKYLRFREDIHPGLRVTAKNEYKDGNKEVKRIETQIDEDTFAFVFQEWWLEEESFHRSSSKLGSMLGRLSVEAHGGTLLEISCHGEVELYTGDTWTPGEIESFLEGNWVNEINEITRETVELHNQQQSVAEQEQKKTWIADQKAKFGVQDKLRPKSFGTVLSATAYSAGQSVGLVRTALTKISKTLAALVMELFSGLGTFIGLIVIVALAVGFLAGCIWLIKYLWFTLPV